MIMQDVYRVIVNLSELLQEVPIKFRKLSEEAISHKSSPEKWSKKEILGHLCDSCFNNIQRLVRVQYENSPFIIYNQDEWVRRQNYQYLQTQEMVDLWVALHRQIIHVIKAFPENHLDSIIDVGTEVTARFVITDYLDHQKHHLNQIFGK